MSHQAAAERRPLLAYETTTTTAAGDVTIRAEAGAGCLTLKLSRFPFTALLISHDEASCLALHLAAGAQRAREA